MNQILFFISSTFIMYAPKFGIWDLSILPLLFYVTTVCKITTINRFLNKWKYELLFLFAVLFSSLISIFIGQIDRAHQDFFIIQRFIKLIIIAYLIYIVVENHGAQRKISSTFLIVLFLHPIAIIFQVIFPSFHYFCIELYQAKYRMAEFRFIGLTSEYTNSAALLGLIFGYTFWYYQKLYYPNANNRNLILALDGLFWSLCVAEFKAIPHTDSARWFQNMRWEITRLLEEYALGLPDLNLDAEEVEEND